MIRIVKSEGGYLNSIKESVKGCKSHAWLYGSPTRKKNDRNFGSGRSRRIAQTGVGR